MSGFAPGRQVGVMAASDRLADAGIAKLGYAAAMTNGNSVTPRSTIMICRLSGSAVLACRRPADP